MDEPGTCLDVSFMLIYIVFEILKSSSEEKISKSTLGSLNEPKQLCLQMIT